MADKPNTTIDTGLRAEVWRHPHIQIIDAEIKWCEDNPDEAPHGDDWRVGFTDGLRQARRLIATALQNE